MPKNKKNKKYYLIESMERRITASKKIFNRHAEKGKRKTRNRRKMT